MRSEMDGGASVMWAMSIAAGVWRGYGTEPVRASHSTQPSEYTSVRASRGSPLICSGET
jgi:hypothetical protein